MGTRIKKAVLAGIIGTTIMTLVMLLAPLMGLPRMWPPSMLSQMLGVGLILGWVLHFMIGIIFALIFTFVYGNNSKTTNIFVKGLIFGALIFVFAQTMMFVIGMVKSMPRMDGSIFLNLIGSLIGHIIFGVTIAYVIEKNFLLKGKP